MDPIKIKIKDFSIKPGSRLKNEGPFSAEEFREGILEPAFENALQSGARLQIDLDGTIGYGTSFLEEVFGGLARKYTPDKVLELVDIISYEEEYLKDDIKNYIQNAVPMNTKDQIYHEAGGKEMITMTKWKYLGNILLAIGYGILIAKAWL